MAVGDVGQADGYVELEYCNTHAVMLIDSSGLRSRARGMPALHHSIHGAMRVGSVRIRVLREVAEEATLASSSLRAASFASVLIGVLHRHLSLFF